MKMLQKAEIRRAAARYGLLLLGTAILSFGLYNVHSQSQITEGGVFGLQLLFQHWFHISPSITGPVMDIACYLAAWKLLGGGFIKNAVIASLGYSFFIRFTNGQGTFCLTWATNRFWRQSSAACLSVSVSASSSGQAVLPEETMRWR